MKIRPNEDEDIGAGSGNQKKIPDGDGVTSEIPNGDGISQGADPTDT